MSPDDPRHGTYNGYNNLGCRCDPCRQAHTDYLRELRHKTGKHKPREEYLKEVIAHGYNRYKRGGCRCDVCRAAAAAQKRRQRANNPEHYREYWRERRRRPKVTPPSQ